MILMSYMENPVKLVKLLRNISVAQGVGEPQLNNKSGRLTTLNVISAAENREPQPQNKSGKILF